MVQKDWPGCQEAAREMSELGQGPFLTHFARRLPHGYNGHYAIEAATATAEVKGQGHGFGDRCVQFWFYNVSGCE